MNRVYIEEALKNDTNSCQGLVWMSQFNFDYLGGIKQLPDVEISFKNVKVVNSNFAAPKVGMSIILADVGKYDTVCKVNEHNVYLGKIKKVRENIDITVSDIKPIKPKDLVQELSSKNYYKHCFVFEFQDEECIELQKQLEEKKKNHQKKTSLFR